MCVTDNIFIDKALFNISPYPVSTDRFIPSADGLYKLLRSRVYMELSKLISPNRNSFDFILRTKLGLTDACLEDTLKSDVLWFDGQLFDDLLLKPSTKKKLFDLLKTDESKLDLYRDFNAISSSTYRFYKSVLSALRCNIESVSTVECYNSVCKDTYIDSLHAVQDCSIKRVDTPNHESI